MGKAAIIGIGQMGLPIAWAMGKLGFKLVIVESDLSKQRKALLKLNSMLGISPKGITSFHKLDQDCDIVIAATPFQTNYEIAGYCSAARMRYCDLGGNSSISDRIKNTFGRITPVMPDLGLAPGLVNFLVEDLFKANGGKAETIRIMCGGLPEKPHGMLKYGLTFNTGGLYNEYTGFCNTLVDGKPLSTPALCGLEEVNWGDIKLEAFCTQGGLGTTVNLMQKRGVKNISYKTLRYPGHNHYIKFMLQECNMDETTFKKCMQSACPTPLKDKVLIWVKVDNKEIKIEIKSDSHWTAMQKATAFPAVAVAKVMTEGLLDSARTKLDYSKIPYHLVQKYLNEIAGDEFKY